MSKCPYRLCYFTWSHDQMLLRRRKEVNVNIKDIEIPVFLADMEENVLYSVNI